MNARLKDLYDFPCKLSEDDIYLQDLAEQCAHLEDKILGIADSLSWDARAILEDYISTRNELEFQSVKRALKIGRNTKK